MKIRRVGNTSRHQWAEIRSLPQSLWMGELTRWVLCLFSRHFFLLLSLFVLRHLCLVVVCFVLVFFFVRGWFFGTKLLCRAPFICKWATLFLETQMEFFFLKICKFLQMGDLIFSNTIILLQNYANTCRWATLALKCCLQFFSKRSLTGPSALHQGRHHRHLCHHHHRHHRHLCHHHHLLTSKSPSLSRGL